MSARRRLLPAPDKRAQPDVAIAIVNIVLLLILFFLATGALVNTPDQGIKISETRDLEIDQLPPPVLIINEDQTLLLDSEPVARALLGQALAEETMLHILMERTAPALDLIDVLEEPGLDHLDIRLVTIHRRDDT